MTTQLQLLVVVVIVMIMMMMMMIIIITTDPAYAAGNLNKFCLYKHTSSVLVCKNVYIFCPCITQIKHCLFKRLVSHDSVWLWCILPY